MKISGANRNGKEQKGKIDYFQLADKGRVSLKGGKGGDEKIEKQQVQRKTVRSGTINAADEQGNRHEQGGKTGNHGELPIARHDEGIDHWQEREKQKDNKGPAKILS